MSLNVIAGRFEQLLAEFSTPPDLPVAVRSVKSRIDDQLRREVSIRRNVLIGSFASGTSVLGYSDVDYLLSLGGVGPEQESDEILRIVSRLISDALGDGLPQIRCPAVVVETGEYSVDLVPACERTLNSQSPVYLIPDCRRGWQESEPEAHIAMIDRVDRIFIGALRRLVRLAKIWKYQWGLPISSYKMERLILDHSGRLCELPCDRALNGTFKLLHDSEPESISNGTRQLPVRRNARGQPVRDTRVILATSLNTSSVAIAASASADQERSLAAWNEVFCGGLLG